MKARATLLTVAVTGLTAYAVAPALSTPGERGPDRAGKPHKKAALRFEVRQPRSLATRTSPGRMIVLVSTNDDAEPRFQQDVIGGIPFWGHDVKRFGPGDRFVLTDDGGTYGYPLERIADLPAGDYYVQAFFHRYTTFHRGDGTTVKLPLPCGDGQNMFNQPSSLYSDVERVRLDPDRRRTVSLALTNEIQPTDPVPEGGTCQQGNPPDSRHVKHVKIQSEALSEFWGRPMHIMANVLLPRGYDDPANADVRYPVVVHQTHYPRSPAPLSETRGGPFQEDGSTPFSEYWLSDSAPRMIVVEIRQETPYYDTSYGVNTANHGPYGDAIHGELIPELDGRFRTIDAAWARVGFGSSTGGWMALASQILYPDVYRGAFAFSPDSPDFRRLQLVNVYEDENAYYTEHEWQRVDRPASRQVSGDVNWTMAQENHWELARGTHSRSGGVWDGAWEATYSPQGPDGYPARIWDKLTGTIDHEVAEQWRKYDLREHLVENWATIGSKVAGNIEYYTGEDDNYFLDLGAHLFEDATDELADPPADFRFEYRENLGHVNFDAFYTFAEMFQRFADHMAGNAPADAPTAWRSAG